MSASEWLVFAVEVDDGVEQVATLLEKLYGVEVKRVWPKARLSVDKDELLEDLKRAGVPENYSESGRALFILGGGEYHHLTHALTRLSGNNEYGVFDWDAHTDDYTHNVRDGTEESKRVISCENFADLMTEDCGAKSIAYFGVRNEPKSNGPTVRYVHCDDPRMENARRVAGEIASRVEEQEVYATVDLDVLDVGEDVRVNSHWERSGSLRLDDLLKSIRTVRQSKDIFAADMTGYNSFEPHSGDNPYAAKERLVTVKSCLAACVVAGEIMGLDTGHARCMMEKIDWKIRLAGYMYLKPECRDSGVLDILERNSDGAPNDYGELLGMR